MTSCSTIISSAPHSARRVRRLGGLLNAAGLIDRGQLCRALREKRRHPQRRLGDILIDAGALSREQLRAALADKLGIDRADLDAADIDRAALALLPAALARRHRALPFGFRDGALLLAMEDPFDAAALTELRFHCRRPLTPLLADAEQLERGLRRAFDHEETHRADVALAALEPAPSAPASAARRSPTVEQQPVARLLTALISQAVGARASDIHLRPGAAELAVYFRVDGKPQLRRRLPAALRPALLNRLKVLGKLDIASRHLPQDGQTTLQIEGRAVDLRLSILPTLYGESASLRVLDKSAGLKSLDQIGFRAHDYDTLRRLLAQRSGMLLVTGPTGAGKSTTLYSMLGELATAEPHIVTLEEPVEYRFDGAEQIAVNVASGLDFATALRSVLRHDPDVILVGEVRDPETAAIAARASLTGHLLLSSLHANDAASAAVRLLDLGVPDHLVGSTLLGVVAQRLVALNCRHCAAPQRLDAGRRAALGVDAAVAARRGSGCARCAGSGVSGRRVVYELMPVDDRIRALIHARKDAYAIREAALDAGMRPLADHARDLLAAGLISVDEFAPWRGR